MREELVPWAALEAPISPALDQVTNTALGLEIVVAEDLGGPERYKIKFDLKNLVSFTVTNDSYTWKRAAERKCPGGALIYTVKNSSLIDFFSDQTEGVTDMTKATHYYIITSEDVIDVISFSEPEVSRTTISTIQQMEI